jgi:uncharacterized Zn finger protein (UPF0148 family)
MADLLIQGGQMTDLTCPECETILFRLKNKDLFCLSCNKKVVVVKNDASVPEEKEPIKKTSSITESDEALSKLRNTILFKIQNFTQKLETLNDPEEITALLKVINKLLGTMDVIKQIN